MNTLAHIAGTLGLFYLMNYSFETLAIPVLGFAFLAAGFMGLGFTALAALQDAEILRGIRGKTGDEDA